MKILAVDEDKRALDYLMHQARRRLEFEQIVGFSDPKDALLHLSQHGADVAVLDMEMMGMSGLEMAVHVKNIQPSLRVVFTMSFSASASGPYIICERGYVQKPVTPDGLEQEILHVTSLQTPGDRTYLRAFGHFDLMVNGEPMAFTEPLSKEALAYLVFRRGKCVRYSTLSAYLSQDGNSSRNAQKRIRSAVEGLKRDVKAAKLIPFLMSRRDSVCVDFASIECDLDHFLKGEIGAVNAYEGVFMSQYPWAVLGPEHL